MLGRPDSIKDPPSIKIDFQGPPPVFLKKIDRSRAATHHFQNRFQKRLALWKGAHHMIKKKTLCLFIICLVLIIPHVTRFI